MSLPAPRLRRIGGIAGTSVPGPARIRGETTISAG